MTALSGASGLHAEESANLSDLGRRAEATVWKGFQTVWEERLKFDMADTTRDTLKTGMIGIEYTPITTTLGEQEAKDLSSRPGWASWLVRELSKRGVKSGSKVAVSMTGSFPALNLAVLAALQELKADIRLVSSVGSSSYGANEPGFTWPEMEALLREAGVLKIGSSAVTMGGTGDRGMEWNEYEQSIAADAIKRSGIPFLKARNLKDAIEKRMLFYGKPRSYVCMINVGGNQASLGGGGKLRFNRGGWFEEPLGLRGDPDGVMDRFLNLGVPCLNLLFLDDLNRREQVLKR